MGEDCSSVENASGSLPVLGNGRDQQPGTCSLLPENDDASPRFYYSLWPNFLLKNISYHVSSSESSLVLKIGLVWLVAASLGFFWYWRRKYRQRDEPGLLLGELSQRMPTSAARRPRRRTDSLGQHSSAHRFFQRTLFSSGSYYAEQQQQRQHNQAGGTHGNGPIHERYYDDDLDYTSDNYLGLIGTSRRQLSPKVAKRFAYQGTTATSISYRTMIPPPSWSEINRRLLQQNVSWELHRSVSLDLSAEMATITLGEATASPAAATAAGQQRNPNRNHKPSPKDFTITVDEIGVHVKSPMQAGILEIYVKESSREEWREHTFRSAAAAAQFQVDLLALQLLGKTIFHMYQALELVHKGGEAYSGGPETILHSPACDPENPPPTQPCGVAWDDVMRCLGTTFTSMRTRLEALWFIQITGGLAIAPTTGGGALRGSFRRNQVPAEKASDPDATTREDDDDDKPPSDLAPKYEGKRLMLGLVDFFRLFVPLLPETAVPQSSSSRTRMEQLLRWRKRAARAAVLVQAYVRARVVVNQGWTLNSQHPMTSTTPSGYLKRRQAFDSNWDNIRRDAAAKNEYYEASVNRDVICHVRGRENLRRPPWWRLLAYSEAPPLSSYQGYSLVGMHSFQWIPNEPDYPLQPHKDPVLTIPSLRELVESHPELEFFVHAFYTEGRQCAMIVKVFVRSLPQGIDPSFDRVVDRFIRGDAALRQAKLECILQLGVDRDSLSIFVSFVLSLLSLFLRLTLSTRQTHVPQRASTSHRTTIPSINLSQCGEVFHFGGALQKRESLPSNYIACATHASSDRKNSLVLRLLVSYFENRSLSKDVMDYTYVIAGSEEDEVPERAVGTVRLVGSAIKACSLPISYVIDDEAIIKKYPGVANTTQPPAGGELKLLFRILIADPILAMLSVFSRMLFSPRSGGRAVMDAPASSPQTGTVVGPRVITTVGHTASADPFEQAVDELIESLRDVTVPVRREQLSQANMPLVDNSSSGGTLKHAGLVDVPLLERMNPDDIRRYLIAANCSLKAAAVRIVQSAAWRGLTFPINKRMCRVELQSGQFFQQGRDLEGNPIFYFRNVCLGRWRGNEDAAIGAVLHRLENAINTIGQEYPQAKFTLIVLMGRPKSTTPELDDESVGTSQDEATVMTTSDAKTNENNPRIYPEEKWHTHTSKGMVLRLIGLVMAHYPERLRLALVVVGHGNSDVRTALGGKLALSTAVSSKRTRERVKFLSRYRDLQDYVEKEALVTIVGGSSVISPEAFEYK